MTSATLGVAIAASILILALRPVRALAVYLGVIMFYPSFLVVSLGTVDVTAHRIVAIVLLSRCVLDPDLTRKFKWCSLDTLVLVYVIVGSAVTFIVHPFHIALENRGGTIVDTWFLYLSVRLCITERHHVLTIAKWLSVCLVPLAVLGAIECYTGYQPFARLAANAPWALDAERGGAVRFGLTRAIGPNGHPIVFGLCFTTLLPLTYYLRHEHNNWRTMAYLVSALAVVGAISSMSSGPFAALMATVACLTMEPLKKYVRAVLIVLVVCLILAEAGSNNPVYYVVVGLVNPFGGAGWHRVRIIDLAIQHFGEWYLLGYGGKDPGWGQYLGMGRTDACNQFIVTGIRFGVWGLVAFCSVLAVALRTVIFAHNSSQDPMMKSLAWALGSILISLMAAFFSVALMGQSVFLFYFVLGMVGAFSTTAVTTPKNNDLLQPIIAART